MTVKHAPEENDLPLKNGNNIPIKYVLAIIIGLLTGTGGTFVLKNDNNKQSNDVILYKLERMQTDINELKQNSEKSADCIGKMKEKIIDIEARMDREKGGK